MPGDEIDGFLWLTYMFVFFSIFVIISILLSRKPFNGYILARNPSSAKGYYSWMYKPMSLGKIGGLNPTISLQPLGLPFIGFCLGCGAASFFAHLYLQSIYDLFRYDSAARLATLPSTPASANKGPYASYFFRAGGTGKSDLITAQYRDFSARGGGYEDFQATASAQFLSIQATTAYVEIIGNADASGNSTDNQRLSEYRAITVRDMLIEAGVPPDIISTRGSGVRRKSCLEGDIDKHQREGCLAQDRRVDVYYYKAPKLISEMH